MLDRIFDERVYGPIAVEPVRTLVAGLDGRELTECLIGGLTKREALERMPDPRSVTFHAMDDDDFLLPPLPNHLFTRDTSCWIHDGVAVNSMRKAARMRESVHYEAIYRWHPEFADADFHTWSEGPAGGLATMEGGDVHVIGRGAVLVGMSERTTPQAVERLALRLFAADAASRIVALSMPKARAFMHLDTVMSMIDAETFTKYAGLGMLPSYTIEPGAAEGELKVTDHPPEEMHRAIANALGLERHPGADAHPGRPFRRARAVGRRLQRAHRDTGCGGAYERNVTSNTFLRRNGVEVVTIAGSELGRGRGGPRCMSCPVEREGI